MTLITFERNYKMRILRALALATCAMVFSSQAAIINYDDTIANSYYDTDSELVWIDFGQTNNLTFDQVLAELGSGGLFYGWRLPTVDEVTQMATNLVYSGTGAPDYINANEDYNGEGTIEAGSANPNEANGDGSVWEGIFDAVGYNLFLEWDAFGNDIFYSQGLYETEEGIKYLVLRDFVDLEDDNLLQTDSIQLSGIVIPPNFLFASPDISTLLVRDAVEVSAPATIGLFSLALIALVRIRRA
jgi:hypothetical protein